MELTSGLEPPNLLITNEVLYRLSYVSAPIHQKYNTETKALQAKDAAKPHLLVFVIYFISAISLSPLR